MVSPTACCSLEAGETPREAALRESLEEIGLPPTAVEILGDLDELVTVHGDTVVTPVVGYVAELPSLTPSPAEVARIFRIPWVELLCPERWQTRHHELFGVRWPLFYFEHDGELLWGLSAFFTLQLLEIVPGPTPSSLDEFRVVRAQVGR